MSTFYTPTSELYHYGVIGMKWGVRKATGHTRKEIRADNKKAFELGRSATVTTRAAKIANKRYDRAVTKWARKETPKSEKERDIAFNTLETAEKNRNKAIQSMNAHRQGLIKKYGSEYVSNIKTDKHGNVNEKVSTGKHWAASFAMALASRAVAASVGSPVAFSLRPSTKAEAAASEYRRVRKAEKKKYNSRMNAMPKLNGKGYIVIKRKK